MMPAAKHFDPILGVDVHIIQPPGPVPPVPIPHPYVGLVFDAFDYVPILGSTVNVNGVPRAIAGSSGKVATGIHFPIGGTFVKPPSNESEMFMGSSTVTFDGDAASYLALPALSCQDIGMVAPFRSNPKKKTKIKSLVLPASVVLAIPGGPPVLIGGPPTISMQALGMKLGMAALGAGLRRLARTNLAKKAGAAFKKARQKLFKNMKPGFMKCKILRAEPVSIITGEVTLDQRDFHLLGRIPIEWRRKYSSSMRIGVCGRGWDTMADARLEILEDTVIFCEGGLGETHFPALPTEEPIMELIDGYILGQNDRELVVHTKHGLAYHFSKADANGNEILVKSITDPVGNFLKFIRDEEGLKQIEESSGRIIDITCKNGLITKMVLNHSKAPDKIMLAMYDYDDRNNLIIAYDSLYAAYHYYYSNNCLIKHTDRLGTSFYYEYDQLNSHRRCVHTSGEEYLYNYYFEYLDSVRELRVTNSLGYTSTIEFDERQLPVREVDALGQITLYEYDDAGRTSAVIDPAGNRTEYLYDKKGNLIRLVRPDKMSFNMTYSEQNLPLAITDPNGFSWLYEWNGLRQLVRRTSPKGATWTYAYNDRGDLISVRDPLGKITILSYDDYGFITSITDNIGHTTRFNVDIRGNVRSITDPMNFVSSAEYDIKSRLISITYPSGRRRDFVYDPEDNLTEIIEEESITKIEYGGLGEVVKRTQPDGSIVRYQYDTEENLIAITNESGQEYRIIRDSIGRIIKEIDYWGNETEYSYRKEPWQIITTDSLNRKTIFEFDSLGRLVAKIYSSGDVETYSYDANGNLINAKNKNNAICRTYDEENRITREVQGNFEVNYEYDLNGKLVLRRTSTGNSITLSYDYEGSIISVRVNENNQIAMKRDSRGLISSEYLGTNFLRKYDYDADGRLLNQELYLGDRLISFQNYRYDMKGNLVEKHDSRNVNMSFVYDNVGRIINCKRYSSRGEGEDTVNETQQDVDEKDKSIDLSRIDAKEQYSFDKNGNLVEIKDDKRRLRLNWDEDNRLVKAWKDEKQTVIMDYDALGRRIAKKNNANKIEYYWDMDCFIGESVLGQTPREIVYYPGTFEPMLLIIGTEGVYYFNNDLIGLPQELYSIAGQVAWSASYDECGRVTELYANEIENPIRLQGQYFDKETGFHFNRRRYYDPSTSAYISKDPLGIFAGHDLYAYAPNVWSWIDPLGLYCTAGKNFKEHFINHKSLLEKKLGKKYPKWKSSMGKEFLDDLDQMIRDGRLRHAGMGTLKKGEPPANIFRGQGLTLVTKPGGEFVTLLESGQGMDKAIQMLPGQLTLPGMFP